MKVIEHLEKIEINADELKDLRDDFKYLMILTNGKDVKYVKLRKEQIMMDSELLTLASHALYNNLKERISK